MWQSRAPQSLGGKQEWWGLYAVSRAEGEQEAGWGPHWAYSLSRSSFCLVLSPLLPRFQPHIFPKHPPWLLLHSQFTHALPKKVCAGQEVGEQGGRRQMNHSSPTSPAADSHLALGKVLTLTETLGRALGEDLERLPEGTGI